MLRLMVTGASICIALGIVGSLLSVLVSLAVHLLLLGLLLLCWAWVYTILFKD